MKILNVMPVTGKNLYSPEIHEYISKYLSKDTELDMVQIKEGTPSIEGEYDEVINTPEIVKLCIQGEKDGYDGIFINCFGDPGVHAARECVDVPVFGGFEPSVMMAMGLADRVGIVTIMQNVVPVLERHVAAARLQERIVSIRSVDIPVLSLGDHQKLCNAVIRESIEAIKRDRAQAIVLGCTGMVDVTETARKGLLDAGYDVPVVEAAQAAVMTLEMYAKMGMTTSRLTYLKPTAKAE